MYVNINNETREKVVKEKQTEKEKHYKLSKYIYNKHTTNTTLTLTNQKIMITTKRESEKKLIRIFINNNNIKLNHQINR